MARDHSWLQNPSFLEPPAQISHPSSSSSSSEDDAPAARKRKRHEKHKRQRKAPQKLCSVKPATVWLDESGLDPKDAFRVDSKPDSTNLRYDSLYSGDVTSYRRRFGSHCVGLGSHQAVKWTDGRGKEWKGKKVKLSRYFKGSGSQSETVLLFPQQQKSGEVTCGDYFALESGGGATVDEPSEKTPEWYISQRTAAYNRLLQEEPHSVPLWMEFLAFQDEALLWNKGAESASDGKKKNHLALIERKLAIFDRALESNPLSVDLLVGQMKLVEEVWETEKIVKRWKDLVFQQPNKPRLWLSYVEFCQTRFSSFSSPSLSSLYCKCLSTLSAIQDGTLRSHQPGPDTPEYLLAIFTLYCSFLKQTGHTEKAVACFQALIEFNLCCPADTEDLPTKERIEFFEAFWDSGVPRFGEESAAGWENWMKGGQQLGLLELIRRAVPSEKEAVPSEKEAVPSEKEAVPSEKDAVPSEKDAVPSEKEAVPSEKEAVPSEKDEVPSEKDEVDPEISLISGLSLPAAWVKLEQHREMENGLPWRPDTSQGETEDDCTDPDRMVLFDDVNQCLFRIPDHKQQLQLLLAFLHFLGAGSPFLQTHLTSLSLDSLAEIFHGGDSMSCLLSAAATPATHKPLGIGYGFQPMGDLATCTPEKRAPKACDFISNVCNQSLSLLSDLQAQTVVAQQWVHSELSHLVADLSASSQLTKELKQKVKTVQKLVKNLLKLEAHRNNLSLWNCCALLEHLVGNCKEATRLYETILSQYSSGLDGSAELVNMYQCFCECLLGVQPVLVRKEDFQPNPALALHALVCLTEGKYTPTDTGVSPSTVLKAKVAFERSQKSLLTVHLIACHAYFEYLTKDIKHGSDVFQSFARKCLETTSSEKQTIMHSVHVALYLQSRLLIHHSRLHPTQPAMLRDILEGALKLFPNDGWFLGAYIESEQQSFISGRIRRYFDSYAPKADTPIPWLFAVRAELQRYQRLRVGVAQGDEPETGTLHRIRALLRRATVNSNGQHCPLLWRMYMKFEVSIYSIQRCIQ